MTLTQQIANDAATQYDRERDLYEKLAIECAELCRKIARDLGVPANVSFRAKSTASFRSKLERYLSNGSSTKAARISDIREAISAVGDLAGVRVTTYVDSDRDRIVAEIMRRFDGVDGQPVDVEVMNKVSGYRATHCQVQLPPTIIAAESRLANLKGIGAEVQICSMLAHVWNEIEHDLRYKVDVDWGDEDTLRDAWLEQFSKRVEEADAVIGRLLLLRSRRAAITFEDEVRSHFDSRFQVPGERLREVLAIAVRMGFSTLPELEGLLDAIMETTKVTKIRQALEAYSPERASNFGISTADNLLVAMIAREGVAIRSLLIDSEYSAELELANVAFDIGHFAIE